MITIGELVLDVEIHQVVGKLQPGRPDVRFGGDRIALALPVALKEGHRKATIHFVWDGKNVPDATCGDMDITETVTGSALPDSYLVSGSMFLAIRDNQIVCTPEFPETRVRIHLKPSDASWQSVNDILAGKHGVCGWVLEKVDVPGLLEGIVQEKGINIKLPVNKIKPFVLPSGVRDTVTVGTRVLAFETRTNTVRVDQDAIWYSADVAVKAP